MKRICCCHRAAMRPYLDEAVLIEILARLPVKSLLRFKCVSRQWRDLISDPVFVKAQLRMSLRENPNPHQGLLLSYAVDTTVYVGLLNIADAAADSSGEELEDTAFTRVDLVPPAVNGDELSAVASCRGLVCLLVVMGGPPGFFLHNPATKETRQLPVASHLTYQRGSFVEVVGLGYDAPSDDDKLIVGTRDFWCPRMKRLGKRTFDIFSLRSNSWRRIGIFDYPFCSRNNTGAYSNGFLHWPLDSAVYTSSIPSLSFDVAKEEFHKGLLPMPSSTGHGGIRWLGVTGGGCLIAQSRDNLEVWIMKDWCGPDSTWTKLCYSPERSWMRNATIFPWIRDGKIILCAQSGCERIAIYDPEGGGSRTTVEFHSVGSFHVTASYVESLVSPHV